MATKPVTFFNFAGGVNSEATPLNIPPTDLVECSNAKVNRNGSLERRGGTDLLDTGSDEINQWRDLASFDDVDAGTALTYQMWDAPVSTKYVQLYTANGIMKKLFVMVSEVQISIYDVSNPNAIRDIEHPDYSIAYKFASYVAPEYTENYIYEKAKIISDTNSIFVINKHAPIQRIWIDAAGVLKSERVSFYTRDLSSNISDDVVFLPTDPDVWDNNWNSALVYLCRKTHTEPEITPGSTYITLAEAQASQYYPPDHPEYWEFWDKRDRESVVSIIPSWPPVPAAYSVNAYGYNAVGYAAATDRTYKSNVTKLVDTGKSDATGWTSGCLATGRLWLAGRQPKSNAVYFSQIVKKEETYRYGYFYQRADPRSFSSINDTDIVDTDGGEIIINEAMTIVNILPYKEGVLVFALNGVWYIGGDNGFKPTNYRVEKISDKGALNAWSTVSNDNFVFYAAFDGIYTITTTKDFRSLEAAPITPKIHTLLNEIPIKNRELAYMTLNSIEQKLYYFYNDTQDWVIYNNKNLQPCHFRQALIFDIPTQSWYEWELGLPEGIEEDIWGLYLSLLHMETLPMSLLGDNEQVLDESGNLVEQEASPLNNPVEVWGVVTNATQYSNICVFGKPNITNGTYDIAFGFFETEGLQDFESTDDVVGFDTSVKFAYQNFGDPIRLKGVPYVQFLFNRTEQGVLDTDTNVDVREGGCMGRFIWNTSNRGVKYGDLRQLYYGDRYTTSYFNSSDSDVNIVTHKQKLRGLGENFQVEITNDGDKPFHLYGWEILVRGFARE